MRTTLTLDPDVAALLEKENRRAREPWKQTVNRTLRSGLSLTTKPAPQRRFVVKPFDLGPTPARFQGMTPSQIDAELEFERYMGKSERA